MWELNKKATAPEKRDGTVFVSYSRSDHHAAYQIRRGLERAGLPVFWDDQIRPGAKWHRWIEERALECSAVVVIWSPTSTRSRWVQREAMIGLTHGKLVPVVVETTKIPTKFASVHCAKLSGHDDLCEAPAWNGVVFAVSGLVANSPTPLRRDQIEDLYYQLLTSFSADGIKSERVRLALYEMSLKLLEEAKPGSLAWQRINRFRQSS